jgi:hypothetical protein
MIRYLFFTLGWFLLLSACTNAPDASVDLPTPDAVTTFGNTSPPLSQEAYYDKILGALVGSAIGDAMGASTEMWHRSAIQKEYGYINDLTPAIREKSPEGTWDHNLTAGATTDDTRWKYFMGQYFSKERPTLSAEAFAAFITDYYQSLIKELGQEQSQKSTDALDQQMEKVNWIKEWARVSMAYQEGPTAYNRSLHRFYGGEMSCAGMLYTPMFGLIEPSPEAAYITAYDHALFDLGYARDISGLVAAMTSTAMITSNLDSVLQTIRYIDPYEYRNSRLIGRLAEGLANSADQMIENAVQTDLSDSVNLKLPSNFPGTKTEWMQLQSIYQGLEREEKAIPFHAGEIWQILYAGLTYGDGDFRKTMAFIVNAGRDNDTVAAIAGMILGAQLGYKALPDELKQQSLKINKAVLGIDLEALAGSVAQEYKN